MVLLGNPDASQALPVMLETVNIDPTVHPAPPETETEADGKDSVLVLLVGVLNYLFSVIVKIIVLSCVICQ